jgi:hypothetical protein
VERRYAGGDTRTSAALVAELGLEPRVAAAAREVLRELAG